MRKPVTKSERIQRLKSLRDNINEVKDDHGFFYRYDIKSPKVMYIEMVSLTEMEYLVKLDKSRYFLKNEIKDEDIDSLADYAVELAAEYKSMNKEKEKTKKELTESLRKEAERKKHELYNEMTLKEYLISIGRAEPETIQNESGIEAPSIAPPVQAPSVNPTKKITKYKIFGITFTKTEITQ